MCSAETDLQEVVWLQTDDLKEQREVTWETLGDYGYVQGAGRQTAMEQMVLQNSLLQIYKHTYTTYLHNLQPCCGFKPGFSSPITEVLLSPVSPVHLPGHPCPASSSHC